MSLIDKLTDLALLMYEEAPYKDIPIDREDLEESLEGLRFMEEKGEAAFFVLYSGVEPVGFLIATVLPRHLLWGTSVKVAAEVAWYVHPSYRSQGASTGLLAAFEKWCTDNGVDVIINAAMHNSSYEQVDRMYKKWGYTPGETAYFKKVK